MSENRGFGGRFSAKFNTTYNDFHGAAAKKYQASIDSQVAARRALLSTAAETSNAAAEKVLEKPSVTISMDETAASALSGTGGSSLRRPNKADSFLSQSLARSGLPASKVISTMARADYDFARVMFSTGGYPPQGPPPPYDIAHNSIGFSSHGTMGRTPLNIWSTSW